MDLAMFMAYSNLVNYPQLAQFWELQPWIEEQLSLAAAGQVNYFVFEEELNYNERYVFLVALALDSFINTMVHAI